MLREIWNDAVELTRIARKGNTSPASVAKVLLYDSFAVLALTRAREAARRWHVPLANRVLRLTQTALYGVDIGGEVNLGSGVFFVHPLGTVVGGDARIGDRVRFFGNNTVGTAKENGYPTIGNDVTVGCGARILGPIHVGDGAVIAANAVVLTDVPAGALAAGVPAVIKVRKAPYPSFGADN